MATGRLTIQAWHDEQDAKAARETKRQEQLSELDRQIKAFGRSFALYRNRRRPSWSQRFVRFLVG